jgi:predicted SAM-dependent methyltransferase
VECHRCLRPGGVLRLCMVDLQFVGRLCSANRTPDVERFIVWYTEEMELASDIYSPAIVLQSWMKEQSAGVLFDEESIAHLLEQAGFSDMVRVAAGWSERDELRRLENTESFPSGLFDEVHLVVEAVKPR